METKVCTCGNQVTVQDNGSIVHADPLRHAKGIGVPFYCPTCEGVTFPIRPIGARVILFPSQVSDKIGSFYIPEKYRDNQLNSVGYVLSVGKGYVDQETGLWHDPLVKPGQLVIFEKSVPWHLTAKGCDGKAYEVKIMGDCDILAIVDLEEGDTLKGFFNAPGA